MSGHGQIGCAFKVINEDQKPSPSALRYYAWHALNYLSPVTHRHVLWLRRPNIAYFRVAKAANSSIRTVLAQAFDIGASDTAIPNQNHFWAGRDGVSNLSTAGYALRPDTRRTWAFSFVRHPVVRLHSCWNNKVIENPELSADFQKMGVTRGMDFEDFVARVGAVPDSHCDIHVVSQSAILSWRGRVLPDFVGKVENAGEDWAHVRSELLDRTGVDTGPLLRRNVRAGTGREILENLPGRVVDAIRTRYAEDFRLFYPDE